MEKNFANLNIINQAHEMSYQEDPLHSAKATALKAPSIENRKLTAEISKGAAAETK